MGTAKYNIEKYWGYFYDHEMSREVYPQLYIDLFYGAYGTWFFDYDRIV